MDDTAAVFLWLFTRLRRLFVMSNHFNLLDWQQPSIRTLHFTWVAFFISFMVWFAHAPLLVMIRDSLGLSDQEVKVLLILNVTLTIPARVLVGMLVDKYGPRLLFSGILISGGLLSLSFALAQDYQQLALARFLSGFVGAGFVVGIRMISEWFPAKQTGLAQGIYGGWGNFGSAGAALLLPTVALWFGAENGWRYAVALTALVSVTYGFAYYFMVRDTPKGSTYFKAKKMGAMEVTSKTDLFLYIFMNLPMYLALAALTWKLSTVMAWIDMGLAYSIYAGLLLVYLAQTWKVLQVNKSLFVETIPENQRYSFSQVAVLDLAYMVTFGTELAVVSMLPLFYIDQFGVEPIMAGVLAGIYPVLNLFALPGGGWLSDTIGRKLTLLIAFSGITASFAFLGQFDSSWSLSLVVTATIFGGIFSKSGSGAVYAMVPLIQRRMTGQIAGMAGAYGNVGGVIFLTVLSFVSSAVFFMVIAATAFSVLMIILLFLREPQGVMVETLEDGTVQLIDVS